MLRSTLIRLNKNSKPINPKIISTLSKVLPTNNSNNGADFELGDLNDSNSNNSSINNSYNNNNNNNNSDNISLNNESINNSNNNNNNNNDNSNNTDIPKKLNSKERNILLRKTKREQSKIIKKDLMKNVKNELDTTLLLDKVSMALPRCSGCGCTLQTKSSKEPGFIPESIALKHMDALNKISEENKKQTKKEKKQKRKEKEIKDQENSRVNILDVDTNDDGGEHYFENFFNNKKNNKEKICQRCHLLKNYGRIAPISIPIEKFRKNLSKLKDLNCVIVKVVDLMDFHGSFIEDFRDIVGNNPVIIVGNKMDLLPTDIHKDRIENWVTMEAKARGLAHVSHVLLLSSINKEGMRQFIVELEKIRRGRDVFVVGCSNVGKSTFVNSLVDEYNAKVEFIHEQQQQANKDNEEEEKKKLSIQEQKELERQKLLRSIQSKITASILPGTTLNLLSLPLWKDSTLFDTPGIDNPKQMLKLLSIEELRQVIPSKRIRPTLVHMIGGKTLFIGGMIRIDYSGPLSTFLVYTSNAIPLHLTSTKKADKLFIKQQGRLLTPPILSSIKNNNNNNNNSIDNSSNELEGSEIFNIMNSQEEIQEEDLEEINTQVDQYSIQDNESKPDRYNEEVLIEDYSEYKGLKIKRKDEGLVNGEENDGEIEEKEKGEYEIEFENYNKDLSPLDLEKLNKFKLEQMKSFTIRSQKIDFKHTRCDLVLSGIGWISIKPLSKKLISPKLLVHSPKNIDVSIRNQPLIPMTNSNVTLLK